MIFYALFVDAKATSKIFKYVPLAASIFIFYVLLTPFSSSLPDALETVIGKLI